MELFKSSDTRAWREALAAYPLRLQALAKPDLIPLDDFYRTELPLLIRRRSPDPFLSKPDLRSLMQWKLSRGKWRPRLLDFVSSLDESAVETSSKKAFAAIPDLAKAVGELTVLKGVGPATASAVLAAYAPDVAPFMSDEALIAAMGNAKEYTLKMYLAFANKLQEKAKELSSEDDVFTPSDIEQALWSSAIASKLPAPPTSDSLTSAVKSSKRRRKS